MVTVHNGTDRISYVGETSTVKLAKIELQKALYEAYSIGKRAGVDRLREALTIPATSHQSIQSYALRGIVANRTEGYLAQEYPDAVVPTRRLLGGLANVQPSVEIVEPDSREVYRIFIALFGQYAVKLHLGHSLEPEGHNLGIHDGVVKFVDAGSDGLKHLLTTNPEKVHKALAAVTSTLPSN